MIDKFLKEAVVVVVGKQSEKIASLLDGKKYINEFLIAKKLDITINQTRNILYKLSDEGLVSSIRKKDKRKGWYTYFWKIEIVKCLEFLKGILEKNVEQINNQIKNRESKRFYNCEKCNIEFNEENALIRNFTCNECGGIFSVKDNSKLLRELKKNLERLKKERSLIDLEIEREKEKLEKKRVKEKKKEEAKKKVDKKKIIKKVKKVVKKSKKKIAHRLVYPKALNEGAKKKVKKKPVKKKIVKKTKSQKKK